MATSKKRKRSSKQRISSAKPRSYSELYKDDSSGVPQQQAKEKRAEDVPVSGKGSESVDWQGEYAYVVRDLRRLALVSTVIFVRNSGQFSGELL